MSTCNVDVRWFPFDIQKCELKFGSWTFDGWLLDLQMNEADISGYMPNGEWDLVGELVHTTFPVGVSRSIRHSVHRQNTVCRMCVAVETSDWLLRLSERSEQKYDGIRCLQLI